jgi:hypothetical protein
MCMIVHFLCLLVFFGCVGRLQTELAEQNTGRPEHKFNSFSML